MARYIYVWDERVKAPGWSPVTKRGENNVMLLKVTEKDPMTAIVSRIVNWADPTGILVLRVLAHGYVQNITGLPPGVSVPPLGLGHGQLGADGLNANMVPKWAALKGKFAPGGRIDLHHCALADPGCQLTLKGVTLCSDWLMNLADALDVPVTAAEQVQTADANWDWEGPTHTWWPKSARDQQAAVAKSLGF
jgi:hypothetical protein